LAEAEELGEVDAAELAELPVLELFTDAELLLPDVF